MSTDASFNFGCELGCPSQACTTATVFVSGARSELGTDPEALIFPRLRYILSCLNVAKGHKPGTGGMVIFRPLIGGIYIYVIP